MKDPNIILATNKAGDDITIAQVESWLIDKSKRQLVDFFSDRFYGRYLKPFDFKNDEYIKGYKNGFAIMTSCCLLIETFVSFTSDLFIDNNFKSERSFGYFFLTYHDFDIFSKGALPIAEYTKFGTRLKGKGVPHDFYKNVRCGLLHNGETRNGWKITRTGKLFDEIDKKVNAIQFMNKLLLVIEKFKRNLMTSDFDNDDIWNTYKQRLQDLINKS